MAGERKEAEEIMRKAALRADALRIVTDVRDQTLDLSIRTVESLYLDSQEMILDADTIDACANILRSLKVVEARHD